MEAHQTSFGAALRRLRRERGLTLKELAHRACTTESHLSRLETGQRPDVSRELLGRLQTALGDGHELAAAAGRLPDAAEQALLRYPWALSDEALERRTLPALRRSHAAARAAEILERSQRAIQDGRVEHHALLRASGLSLELRHATAGPPVEFSSGGRHVTVRDLRAPGDPGLTERLRFLAAHALAHADGEQRACRLPVLSADEQVACDVAAALLAPRRLLLAATAVRSTRANVWAPDGAYMVFTVAERLGIPAWVAVQRLADEELLESRALAGAAGSVA